MRYLEPQKSNRVLVVGDLMLDRYLYGSTKRISPEAPVPVVLLDRTDDFAGGAGNVAVNLVALNVSTNLLALVGKDQEGEYLRLYLEKIGVNSFLFSPKNYRTITKLRIISHQQQLLRLDHEEQNVSPPRSFLTKYRAFLKKSKVVVLSDYGKGCLHKVELMLDMAKQSGKLVLIDPKGQDYTKYTGASLLTPNLFEFEKVVGQCLTEKQRHERGFELCHQLKLGALLVTRGSQGMDFFQFEGASRIPRVLHFPTQVREVYDVTGAGDTVIATIAASLAAGNNLFHAIQLANHAAGIAVSKLGTTAISKQELNHVLAQEEDQIKKIISLSQLDLQIKIARANRQKVVFTNGCFDLLHPGHIKLLEKAKMHGDILIVAVNSDSSVRKLKGTERPINTLKNRLTVLQGLACIDWLVSFSALTPIKLIEKIRPDVLVKGGDYSIDQVVGADIVIKYGGVVKFVPLAQGNSTTNVLRKISRHSGKN